MNQEQIIDVLNEAQTEFKGINEANIHSADILITMFEKQKLEFAIEQLKRFRECTFGKGKYVIKELEQKLSEL